MERYDTQEMRKAIRFAIYNMSHILGSWAMSLYSELVHCHAWVCLRLLGLFSGTGLGL
jgi:hypothetical protein